MPTAAVRSSAAAIILLGATLGIAIAGCGRRPPKVETVLSYEIDPEALPGNRAVNMLDVLAVCRRRLCSSPTPLGDARQSGPRQIEIGVYGRDPDQVRRVEALLAPRGDLELRILANRRDHAALVQQAQGVADEFVRDGKQRTVARWVTASPGSEQELRANAGIVLRSRRIGDRDGLEVLVVCDSYNITGKMLHFAALGAGNDGGPEIHFNFYPDGGRLLNRLTSENLPDPQTSFKRQLGILFDGRLVLAPNVTSALSAFGRITGRFTRDEAQLIVDVLNAGNMPAPLRRTQPSPRSSGAGAGASQRKP